MSWRPFLDPTTVLAALPDDVPAVAVRDGAATVVAAVPSRTVLAGGGDALAFLDGLDDGWWAGWLAYDLGRACEPVSPRTDGSAAPPDLALARFDARVVCDPRAGTTTVEGDGPGRPLLERAVQRAGAVGAHRAPPGLTEWRSSLEQSEFEAGVRAVVELIRSGDCYQANLTRRLSAGPSDPVVLFAGLTRRNPAPHAAFVRLGRWAVVSASPERFLARRGDVVETRPVKGTARDAATLAASEKDRAENVMIVDLARNDLGRVCEYGSVEVPALCALEAHPGLHHLVSTVRGRLRPGVGTGALVRATFPPASVTGAPKPRVMQVIEDLEPVRRGVYCGAVGWIDAAADRLDLNVAIRTFTVTAEATTLGVGGGIVADSDPRAEWEETELKAARLLAAAGERPLVAEATGTTGPAP